MPETRFTAFLNFWLSFVDFAYGGILDPKKSFVGTSSDALALAVF